MYGNEVCISTVLWLPEACKFCLTLNTLSMSMLVSSDFNMDNFEAIYKTMLTMFLNLHFFKK